MSPEDARIREMQAAVEAARVLLLSPSSTALDRSLPLLERAAEHVIALKAAPCEDANERATMLAGLFRLRQAVARITALLENSSAFYWGWSRQAAAAACGYTPSGQPATPNHPKSLFAEG